MKTLRIISGLGLAFLGSLGSGCASLQSVSVTNIPRERGRPVSASADNPAFLGLHFDNDFADGLPDELRRQCPDGKVTGIYSKYQSTWYVLVQSREVTVHGYCVVPEHQAAAPPAIAPPPVAAPPAIAPPPAPTEPATSALEQR
ncbi:MAG TPA: hypothetical protein VHB79_05015 [Polyangiaceae bacterium]|nr:hypothetical protein [Polyangiaceae bacterium]